MVDRNKVIDLLNYAKTPPFATGKHGYHTVEIQGEVFDGQRNCMERIQPVLEEIKGKNIVDFGCNIGGSLHSISEYINSGVGFDNNVKYINTANAVKSLNSSDNLSFYVFDVDKDGLSILNNFIFNQVDICMMLSIAKWVKKWQDLVRLCYALSDILIFETNGSDQNAQIEWLKQLYEVSIVTDRSLDDVGQHRRKLLLCRKKVTE